MTKPYGVASDTHSHNWTQFSHVLPNGVNSRLQAALDEIRRLRDEVIAAGGNTIYHGGDLFHVRGNIAPSVLNPTLDLYRDLTGSGIRVRILAGNHDLEGSEAHRVGSAVTALEGIGCEIVNEPTLFADDRVAMIPWIERTEDLKKEIQNTVGRIHATPSPAPLRSMESVRNWTLIIHAPIDGVISGLPNHGLTAVELKSFGFKLVLSGHYHHHKKLDEGVYSIGALAHYSWSDVGHKAGFLVVDDSNVRWFKSHLPEFIEIDSSMEQIDIEEACQGNYVRIKLKAVKQIEVEKFKKYLTDCGALGITAIMQKDSASVARANSTVTAGASIEVSVSQFISNSSLSNSALDLLCQDILSEARMEVVN